MSTPPSLIDSHCHLDRFHPDELPELFEHAREAGVVGMVTIGTRLSEAARQVALTKLDPSGIGIWCTIGTHPDHVGEEALSTPELLAAGTEPARVVGLGESGLDYFHGRPEDRSAQQASFRTHIRAARLAGLPLVIHARDADHDMMEILREEHRSGGASRFVLHCFSSSRALADCALELGGFVSFSGMLTFPKLQPLRDIAAALPIDRILVETDAPYLAPVPRRGRRNQPAFVTHTAATLAQLHGMTPEALHEVTRHNFLRLFTKAA